MLGLVHDSETRATTIYDSESCATKSDDWENRATLFQFMVLGWPNL